MTLLALNVSEKESGEQQLAVVLLRVRVEE